MNKTILVVILSTLNIFSDGFTVNTVNRLSSVGRNPVDRLFADLDVQAGIGAINSCNSDLFGRLESLRKNDDFRYYSVDILASCEYMAQELFECYTESCEIYPVDDGEVPGRLMQTDKDEANFELDGWARWDMPSLDYYDIEMFPEGYTGYDGSEIWSFIHNRICFKEFGYSDDHWKSSFNRAVSGLHSMISLQIIQGIKDKIANGEAFTAEEIWRDPKQEFDRRLSPTGETPTAKENLYFTYMLLLGAFVKTRERVQSDLNLGKIGRESQLDLDAAFQSAAIGNTAAETVAAKLQAQVTKYDAPEPGLWEARMRTRELLRIMNCVQCNKCRLHGKIAIMGVSTALQILIGKNGNGCDPSSISRVELSALISTLHKFSRALKLCVEMEQA